MDVFSGTSRTLTTSIALAGMVIGATGAGGAQAADGPAPLIERQKLLGNPSRSSASLSPDGKHLAFLAPREGVMNVWVAPIDDIDQAKPVTEEKGRPIPGFFWSPDSEQILYVQDKGGDENYLLYGVDLDSMETRTYTDLENVRVTFVGVSPQVEGEILIGLNNRDPRWHDVHRLNLDTGEMELVPQNDGYQNFVADRALKLRLAVKPTPDGGYLVERINEDGSLDLLTTIPSEDALTTAPVAIPANADYADMLDSRHRGRALG